MGFKIWRENHSLIENNIFYPKGIKGRWGRIDARWHQKKAGKENLTHLCAFTLDLQTGDIYTDCSQSLIWMKCVGLTVVRPFYGLLKTAYHLVLPLSIPIEILKAVMEGLEQGHSAQEIRHRALLNIKESIADIFYTPLYTIALTIVTLAAVLIGPFASDKLYDLRALAGRLENSLNRGKDDLWTWAPCFQPIGNVIDIDQMDYLIEDTDYEVDPTLHGLNNLARNYVRFKRTSYHPCNLCRCLLSDDKPYISADADPQSI